MGRGGGRSGGGRSGGFSREEAADFPAAGHRPAAADHQAAHRGADSAAAVCLEDLGAAVRGHRDRLSRRGRRVHQDRQGRS